MARVTYTDWTIPVAQIGSRAGQSMEIDKAFHAPGGIGDTIVGITEGSDVQVRGRFDSIVDGLIFTGSFTAPVHAVCTRCDTPLDRDWTANSLRMARRRPPSPTTKWRSSQVRTRRRTCTR